MGEKEKEKEKDVNEMKVQAKKIAHKIGKVIDNNSSIVCLVALIHVLEFIFRQAPTNRQRDLMREELETFIKWIEEADWEDEPSE